MLATVRNRQKFQIIFFRLYTRRKILTTGAISLKLKEMKLTYKIPSPGLVNSYVKLN